MIIFSSFNHLICPEPGCDHVSEERKEIERHMISDHMSVPTASLKLFFCPTCSQNLELKSGEKYDEHVNWCHQNQVKPVKPSLSIEDNELTQEPTPRQVANVTTDPSGSKESPKLSYSQMIAEALIQAEDRMMSLSDIQAYITQRYSNYRKDAKTWQRAIIYNLSVNPRFHKVQSTKYQSNGKWTMQGGNQIENILAWKTAWDSILILWHV